MTANDLATFADYRRLILDSMGGRRKYVPLVVFLGVVAAIVEGFGIGLVIPVIGIIIDGARPAGGIGAWFASIGAGWDPALRLLLLAGLVIVFVAAKNVLTYFNSVLVSYLFGQAGHRTRLRLARRVLTLDYRTIVTEPPGHVLNILSNESWRMSDAVQLLLRLIVAASASLIFLLILFLLSWWLTLGVLVGTIIVQLVHHVLSNRLKSVGRRLTTNNHALASRMLHLVSAGKLIRLFGRHESELEWFGNHSERVREAALSLDRRKAVLPALTEVLNIILFFAITVAAWNAGLTFAVIVSFIVLLYRMQPQVREMQMHWAQLQGLTGSLEEVQRLLDMEGANRRSGTFREHERVESAIEFDDVTFFYPGQEGEEPVLRNVSFTLPEGRSVALVGPSGSGKSTIVNLLCGFFQPTSGLIRIDGQPLGTLSPGSWRRKMALASQELELADGTIAENIAYGREDASKDEIENAARMAEAHDFITTFPSGYETNVGFRGASLSGGQRQRIALARALVRHPDFLILDEATNALDGISERAIIHTLRARTGKGTTLVISHHDSGLASCDTIIRIAGGRLVE